MSSAVTGKGVPVKVPSRSIRLSVLRLMRMAVAFVVVAGSLGLATVAASAQSGGSSCPSDTGTNLPYKDVPENHFAFNDIRCLLELGITQVSGDSYRPGDDVTRAEMAAFMARTHREVTGSTADVAETLFTDVADHWAADYIGRIFGLGVTTGTSATTYSPDAAVSRAHMALFLSRLYEAVTGSAADAADTGFTDIGDLNDEQQAAIGQIFGLGVTTGTSATTYSPADNVNRAQMASFIARMYRNLTADVAPGVPTGVEVAVSGEDGTALDVSWTAAEESGSEAVTGYVVQWKSGDADYSEDNQMSVSDTSASLEDLTQGDAYTFRVAAVSDAGTGDWSDVASGTPATVPGAVGNLKVTAGNKTLSVTWSAPVDGGSPVTGYTIRWGRDAGEEAEAAGDALGYTITLLKNDVSYSVSVIATNAVGGGEAATVNRDSRGSTTTPTEVASSAPNNLTLTPDPEGLTTTLTARWTPPSDTGGLEVKHYEYQTRATGRTTGITTAWSTIVSVSIPVPKTFVHELKLPLSVLPQGDLVEFRIRADNTVDDKVPDTGLSAWATASATPVKIPGAPNTTLYAGHKSIQVTWAAPGDDGGSAITGYKVSHSSGGSPTEVSVGADTTTHLITGLLNSFEYTVNVKAVNARGDSKPGTSETTKPKMTKPIPVPAAPSNVTAVVPPKFEADGKTQDNNGMKLDVSWNAPADNGTAALMGGGPVTGYVVSYRTSAIPGPRATATCPQGVTANRVGGCSAGELKVSALTAAQDVSRSVTLGSLQTGFSYDVLVRATNAKDNGSKTQRSGPVAVASGTPANTPDMVAAAGIVVEPGYRLLTVSWAPPASNGSDITHYVLRYAENTTKTELWSSDIRINAPRNVHVLTNLKGDTAYVVQIQAVNSIGTSDNSDSTHIKSEGATGGFPSAPLNVTAVPKKDGNGSTLTISWSKVTASNGGGVLNGYQVETLRTADTKGTPTGDGWVTADLAGACDDRTTTPNVKKMCDQNTTTVDVTVDSTATAANVGSTYLVRVRATTASNSLGSNGYAAPVKSASVLAAPGGVTAVFGDAAKSINVNWTGLTGNDAKGVTGYSVRWYPSIAGAPGATGNATVSGATASSYTITGLTPGTYQVAVAAINAVGKSMERSVVVVPGQPGTVPDAPGAPTLIAAHESIQVTWAAPGNDGGSAITGYKVSHSSDGSPTEASVGADTTTHSFTGLSNGVEYTVEVRAVNAIGDSEPGTATVTVNPLDSSAPTNLTLAPEPGTTLTARWGPPSDTGGRDVEHYEFQYRFTIRATGITTDWSSPSTPELEELKQDLNFITPPHGPAGDGDLVEFRIRADYTDADPDPDTGLSAWVTVSATITTPPGTVPDAPTTALTLIGDESIRVTWEAPGNDGGSAITGYKVKYSDDESVNEASVGADITTYSVTGLSLSNGVEYTVEVRAVNAIGDSEPGTATVTVNPGTVPDAPTTALTLIGDESIQVTWAAPGNDGGSAITGYKVKYSSDGLPTTEASVGADITTYSVTGLSLSSGVEYTVEVRAVNAIGDSEPGTATVTVNLAGLAIPSGRPDAPGDPTLIAAHESIQVTWAAPGNDGGSAIISYYVVVYYDDPSSTEVFLRRSTAVFLDGDTTTHSFTGLRNGVEYTVEVWAVNAIGYSEPGTATVTVNPPGTVPDAPTTLTFTAAHESIRVTWAAPGNDGGSAITGYKVKYSDDESSNEASVGADTTTHSVTGLSLSNGVEYTVEVRAVNAIGDSEPGTATVTVNPPGTVPDAPTTLTFTAAHESIRVTWAAPGNDGGSAITGYKVKYSDDESSNEASVGADTTTHSVTGLSLSNGVEYTVEVRAVNAIGDSEPGTATVTVNPLDSSAPTNLTLAPEPGTTLTARWGPPSDTGGRDVEHYEFQYRFTIRATGITTDWSSPSTPELEELKQDLNFITPPHGPAGDGDLVEFRIRADYTDADPDPDTGLSAWVTVSATVTTPQ